MKQFKHGVVLLLLAFVGVLNSCCDTYEPDSGIEGQTGVEIRILGLNNDPYYPYYSSYSISKIEIVGTNRVLSFPQGSYYYTPDYIVPLNPADTVFNLRIEYYHPDTPATTLSGTVSLNYHGHTDYVTYGCRGSELVYDYDVKVGATSFASAAITDDRYSSYRNPVLEIRR